MALATLAKSGVLEFHAKRDEAGLLLFDIHEVEGSIIEDDLNYGRFPFNLRQ
jgi:hypothetical protein